MQVLIIGIIIAATFISTLRVDKGSEWIIPSMAVVSGAVFIAAWFNIPWWIISISLPIIYAIMQTIIGWDTINVPLLVFFSVLSVAYPLTSLIQPDMQDIPELAYSVWSDPNITEQQKIDEWRTRIAG